MLATLGSVLVASLAGSLHCAGMCGGIAAIAVQGNPTDEASTSPSRGRHWPIARTTLLVHLGYQGGRLLSYCTLGALAGAFGSGLVVWATRSGFGTAAALASGLLMIGWALWLLRNLHLKGSSAERSVDVPLRRLKKSRVTGLRNAGHSAFSKALGVALKLPPFARSLWLGMTTGLLPCGWLYVFVLMAAGSSSAANGALILGTFWLGSIPVLSSAGIIARLANTGLHKHMSTVSAILLLALGLTNLWHRSQAPQVSTEISQTAQFDATDAQPSCHAHPVTQLPSDQ